MEQKTKFLLFALVGVILICAVFLAQTLKVKQDLTRERDDLQKDKISLENKVGSLESSLRSYETKITSLNKDLMKVSQEKEDLLSKYELANKTRDDLIEKLKERMNSVQPVSAPVAAAVSQNNDVYWAGILQAKLELETQLVNVRNELRSISITNDQLQREKSALGLQITSLKRENEDAKRQMEYDKKMMQQQLDGEKKKIEQQLEDNKRIISSISQSLVIEKNDKMKIEDNSKTIRNENFALIRQIESLNSAKARLEEKLKKVQDDKSSVELKFKDIEGLLSENISQVNELKDRLESKTSASGQAALVSGAAKMQKRNDSVELSPIVVRSKTMAPVSGRPVSEGKVLAVNKEGNFVIVDMGDDAGLQNGDTFIVYREGKRIASLEVIRTSKSVSACDIKKQDMPIKIGDLIK